MGFLYVCSNYNYLFYNLFLFTFVFKKELHSIKFISNENLEGNKLHFSYSNLKKEFNLLNKEQKHVFLCLGIMFFMFLTQFIHNINTLIIMSICVLLLLLRKIVGFSTLKEINWKVLIFYSSIFNWRSVKVLWSCRYNGKLFDKVYTKLFRNYFNIVFDNSHNNLEYMSWKCCHYIICSNTITWKFTYTKGK